MDAYLLCRSQHLDACEITQETIGTIKGVGFEKVGINREEKGVIHFYEFTRALVVNREKLNRLIALFGSDTSDWIDQKVILYPSQTLVDEGDQIMPCVRIKGLNGEVFAECDV